MNIFHNMFSSLYHKDFRNFWFGQVVSTIGSMIQVTVLSWYIYKISGSPFLLGLMGVFEFGPVLLFTLFMGVWIERFPKKKILLFTQSLFMVQSLSLTILVWSGSTNYGFFAMLALLSGIGMSIDQPTRQSYFVELVGEKDLPNAISLNSTTFNLARIIGPIIAGVMMKHIGVAECFLINGLSFIPVIYGVSLIKTPPHIIRKEKEKDVLNDIKKGFQYAFKNNTIFPTFLIMLVVCTFSMNINVLLPVFAKDVLCGDEGTYSLLMSVFGIGSLCGALFMGSIGQRISNKNFLILTAVAIAIFHLLTLLSRHSIVLTSILLILAGFFIFCFLNRANTRIQLNTTDALRSRIVSIYIFITTGSSPLGNTFSGYIMKSVGQQYGFAVNGIITLALVMLLFIIYRKILYKARVIPVSDKDKQDIAHTIDTVK